MRLESNLIGNGWFWSPQNESERFSGTLTISEGGNVELQITSDREAFVSFDEISVDMVLGSVSSLGDVTLVGGLFTKKQLPLGGPANSSISFSKAYIGTLLKTPADLMSAFSFEVEGIEHWITNTGLSINYERDAKTTTITYQPIPPIAASLASGLEIKLLFNYKTSASPTKSEATVSQRIRVIIESTRPEETTFFMTAAHRFTNLLCFFAGTTLSIQNVNVLPIGTELTPTAKLYYRSLPYTEHKPKIRALQFLIRYTEIRDRWQQVLEKWFESYDKLSPALSLYFATQDGTHKYLDTKFLSLAQCLETFSRRTHELNQFNPEEFEAVRKRIIEGCPEDYREWLAGKLSFANEMNLTKRLSELISPFKDLFGGSQKRKSLIRKIVITRNYMTHYDKSTEAESAKERDIWLLTQKMEALFELNMLRILDLENEAAIAALKRHEHLWNKLNVA